MFTHPRVIELPLAEPTDGRDYVTRTAVWLRGSVHAGEAIVLGPDGGLTGGYPVVGVVASVDLDRVSALAAGAGVSFRRVDPEDAALAHQRRVAMLRGCITHPAHLP